MITPANIKAPSTDIALVVEQSPVVVLTDSKQREAFYAHIEREVEAFEPDTSTEKGRKAIKSMAYKITRTKTAIDDAGKHLNEEARARINAVDAERRAARERLSALAEQVRRPVDEWEAAEEARIARANELIASFRAAAAVTMEDTSATIRARGKQVYDTEVGADLGGMQEQVQAIKDGVIGALKTALAYALKEEADRAELEKLRAEAAEREERDRKDREDREAAEREAAEAKAAEERRAAHAKAEDERRVAAEKAEAARIEQARKDAEQAAERKAQEEQAKRDREHAEELAAERRRAEEAERAAQAERDRIAAAEAERQAEADRLAAEQAQRDADKAHRTKVKTTAKQAMMSCGADEETAKKIVVAILAGKIPNVSLRF
ncbi:hypothetical protein UFOVP5_34 [uncultured Caudovirales phage]|uniref:Uncharacterized protein n=1 Tax=uncultured Caudovirales phage TaxID=2100421 RepID=A0A6J5KIY3_9CAUD|nr:hypothetical protein UFOVP5_34 [uncultured Caudovirales phage]